MSSRTNGSTVPSVMRRNQSVPTAESGDGQSTGDAKPREEQHYDNFYPTLDEEKPLKVIVMHSEMEDGDRVSRATPGADIRQSVFQEQSIREGTPEIDDTLLHRLGYKRLRKNPHHERSSRNTRDDAYIRPQSDFVYGLTNNSLLEEDKFQVMYDADEQDAAFIDILQEMGYTDLTLEWLEVALTFLEKEWYLLERIMPPKKKSFDTMSSDEMINKASQHTSIYGSDDGTGNLPEEDQACAVCNESECDNSNAIVFCDGCDIAVHQECYGVVFIPEGQWLCRSCLISRNNKAQCLFCPSKTGAFKQTEEGSWCHVICALWINELYFASPIYMEPVKGAETIPKSRWRLSCYICRQKMGACIQCSNKNCFQAYHVTCARRSELYLNARQGTQVAINSPETLVSYCDKHCPASYSQAHDMKTAIEKTRLYFATVGAIKDRNRNRARQFERGQMTKRPPKDENPFRWKSHLDTPIAPELFASRLEAFLKGSGAELDRENVYRLCAYWSLKREHKKGAALIKRLDAPQYGSLQHQEIEERLKFLEVLQADVDKIYELAASVGQRTSIETKLVEAKLQIAENVHYPIKYIIGTLVQEISKKLDNKQELSSAMPFGAMKTKNKNYGYSKVEDFWDDFQSAIDTLRDEAAPETSMVRRMYGRWAKDLDKKFESAVQMEKEVNNKRRFSSRLQEDGFKISGTEIEKVES